MGVDKLLEICDNMINGNATADEINCAANVLESILTHIKDFVDETNYSPVGYPIEYFNRNADEGSAALETFCNILEEMDDYFYC